jgi:hypothetical protein
VFGAGGVCPSATIGHISMVAPVASTEIRCLRSWKPLGMNQFRQRGGKCVIRKCSREFEAPKCETAGLRGSIPLSIGPRNRRGERKTRLCSICRKYRHGYPKWARSLPMTPVSAIRLVRVGLPNDIDTLQRRRAMTHGPAHRAPCSPGARPKLSRDVAAWSCFSPRTLAGARGEFASSACLTRRTFPWTRPPFRLANSLGLHEKTWCHPAIASDESAIASHSATGYIAAPSRRPQSDSSTSMRRPSGRVRADAAEWTAPECSALFIVIYRSLPSYGDNSNSAQSNGLCTRMRLRG